MDRTVTVVGSASVAVEPDCARLHCGVQLTGANAQEALGGVNEAMSAIIRVVTASGISRADIRTGGPNLFPSDQGYVGSSDLSVLIRDVSTAGDVIDAVAAGAGPNLTMGGVTFSVLDPGAHLAEARAAAVAAALVTATELAAAAGAELGEVLTIHEGPGFGTPMPIGRTIMATSATPIEPGAQQLRVDVIVTYRLLDAG
jgi:uncharacterized protein YggE